MLLENKKVAVIGSGSWATALAKILLENLNEISWFIRDPENIEQFKQFKHNPKYLKDVEFDISRIRFSSDINETAAQSDILVLAIPSAFLGETLGKLEVSIADKFVVSGIKGIVSGENLIVGEYLNRYFGIPFESVGVIAGPCHAEEVALEQLSYLTIACPDETRAAEFAALLQCDYIKAKTSDDIWGTEYSSVLKNIVAIAAGIFHGLGYGDNFQAVLISNAIQEIERFVGRVHPISRDIKSPAYLGDLLVTAYSQFSRNRTFGAMIGKGYSVNTAKLEMLMVAEGYYAARSIKEINDKYNVDMPITQAVYNILYNFHSPKKEMFLLTEKIN